MRGIKIPKQFLGFDSRPVELLERRWKQLQRLWGTGPPFFCFLQPVYRRPKTKEGKADYRAFSRRVLEDHPPLGSPWRGAEGLRRSANPWNLFEKSMSVLAGSVIDDKDPMLWS